MSEILDQFFAQSTEDLAIDFMFDHLNDVLKAGNYELVNNHLKELMDNEHYWNLCVTRPIYSLAFLCNIHQEPEKFSYRKDFIIKLREGYITHLGEKRANNLLMGLSKDL